jgi:hypothetical protein
LFEQWIGSECFGKAGILFYHFPIPTERTRGTLLERAVELCLEGIPYTAGTKDVSTGHDGGGYSEEFPANAAAETGVPGLQRPVQRIGGRERRLCPDIFVVASVRRRSERPTRVRHGMVGIVRRSSMGGVGVDCVDFGMRVAGIDAGVRSMLVFACGKDDHLSSVSNGRNESSFSGGIQCGTDAGLLRLCVASEPTPIQHNAMLR